MLVARASPESIWLQDIAPVRQPAAHLVRGARPTGERVPATASRWRYVNPDVARLCSTPKSRRVRSFTKSLVRIAGQAVTSQTNDRRTSARNSSPTRNRSSCFEPVESGEQIGAFEQGAARQTIAAAHRKAIACGGHGLADLPVTARRGQFQPRRRCRGSLRARPMFKAGGTRDRASKTKAFSKSHTTVSMCEGLR